VCDGATTRVASLRIGAAAKRPCRVAPRLRGVPSRVVRLLVPRAVTVVVPRAPRSAADTTARIRHYSAGRSFRPADSSWAHRWQTPGASNHAGARPTPPKGEGPGR
jgi:hypothetical protein